jgi:hypothetical protein
MPSKVSKNKKPLEIVKIEESLDDKLTKQQQREKLKNELALLNSDSEEIEEESPVIERVKNIKQKDSSLNTQNYANEVKEIKAKRERTEKQKEQFQKALEVKKLNAERRKEEQRLKEEQDKAELEKKIISKAISLKKKQIKKQQVLDEISDDETPIEKIKKPSKKPPPGPAPASIAQSKYVFFN